MRPDFVWCHAVQEVLGPINLDCCTITRGDHNIAEEIHVYSARLMQSLTDFFDRGPDVFDLNLDLRRCTNPELGVLSLLDLKSPLVNSRKIFEVPALICIHQFLLCCAS